MDQQVVDRLLEKTRGHAAMSEKHRAALMRSAWDRQESILGLHAFGLSIREIAAKLGTSPSVVQSAIGTARRRRPTLQRREERVPYELHVQLALKLHEDEASVRRIGQEGVARMRRKARNPLASKWLDRWEELLISSADELERAMLAEGETATEMRQLSPFAGALTEAERLLAIKKAAALAQV